MAAYLKLVVDLFLYFKKFKLLQIPSLENAYTDSLLKPASSKDSELLKIVPFEHLAKPSITRRGEVM